MGGKYLIYALIDPTTLMVRYIGKSCTGVYRINQHRRLQESEQTHCARWKRAVLSSGLKWVECVLDTASCSDTLAELERWWIAYGRACGWPLTNMTDGGDGASCGALNPSKRPEVKDKQVAALTQYWTPEKRKLQGQNSHTKLASYREQTSARVKNDWARDTQRRQRLKDNHPMHNPAVVAKMKANAKRGDENPAKRPEVREKMRLASRRPQELRDRISAIKRRWTDEQLVEAVQQSHSLAGVARYLGIFGRGSHIKPHIRRLGLNTSHFLRVLQ